MLSFKDRLLVFMFNLMLINVFRNFSGEGAVWVITFNIAVFPNVSIDIIFLSRRIIALGTLKRLFPCVSSSMLF